MTRRETGREATGLHVFPRWFFRGALCVSSPLCLSSPTASSLLSTVFCCHVLIPLPPVLQISLYHHISTTPPFFERLVNNALTGANIFSNCWPSHHCLNPYHLSLHRRLHSLIHDRCSAGGLPSYSGLKGQHPGT